MIHQKRSFTICFNRTTLKSNLSLQHAKPKIPCNLTDDSGINVPRRIFTPHALKPKSTTTSSCCSPFDLRKTDPISRNHVSLVGISMNSIRALSCNWGEVLRSTASLPMTLAGSYRASNLTSLEKATSTSSKSPRKLALRCGQATHVGACGVHSTDNR